MLTLDKYYPSERPNPRSVGSGMMIWQKSAEDAGTIQISDGDDWFGLGDLVTTPVALSAISTPAAPSSGVKLYAKEHTIKNQTNDDVTAIDSYIRTPSGEKLLAHLGTERQVFTGPLEFRGERYAFFDAAYPYDGSLIDYLVTMSKQNCTTSRIGLGVDIQNTGTNLIESGAAQFTCYDHGHAQFQCVNAHITKFLSASTIANIAAGTAAAPVGTGWRTHAFESSLSIEEGVLSDPGADASQRYGHAHAYYMVHFSGISQEGNGVATADAANTLLYGGGTKGHEFFLMDASIDGLTDRPYLCFISQDPTAASNKQRAFLGIGGIIPTNPLHLYSRYRADDTLMALIQQVHSNAIVPPVHLRLADEANEAEYLGLGYQTQGNYGTIMAFDDGTPVPLILQANASGSNSGTVGIGTTSVSAQMQILPGTSTMPVLRLQQRSGQSGNLLEFANDSNVVFAGARADGLFNLPIGVATFRKAGTISDADWTTAPLSGTLGVDTSNGRLYVRVDSTWMYVELTT